MGEFKIDFKGPTGNEGDLCFYSKYGIDTYRAGCLHDCIYCYSRSANKYQYKKWNPHNPSVLNTDWLETQFRNAFETDRRPTKVTNILRQRIPIRIGMNSDPFMPNEKRLKVTYDTLKLFHKYKYPFMIFTKNDLVAQDDYLQFYDKDNSYIQMTVTTLDKDYATKIEQNAPSPRKRIDAIHKLSKLGFKTAFRINPLFPIYPDGYYSKQTGISAQKLDYFTFDLVEEMIKANPHCIIAGFLRVCNKNMHDEFKDKGHEFDQHYHINKTYYSSDEIGIYYTKIKELCDANGVNFSVCFDANGNYDTFKSLWANPEDCCCAKGMIKGFKKTARDAR